MRVSLFVLSLFLASAAAQAEDVPTLELSLTGTVFTPPELHIPAGKAFIIKFKNNNPAAAELEAKDLGIEKAAAANSEIIVRVKPIAAGKYLFVNEYEEDVAKGFVISE